ncbi:hypothetical protein [Botrimarina sp.]|uniref:hypothetical protein n=1 Tax=Botrimarina sp. TaxID=2795802 RepID=UPI0032ECAF88
MATDGFDLGALTSTSAKPKKRPTRRKAAAPEVAPVQSPPEVDDAHRPGRDLLDAADALLGALVDQYPDANPAAFYLRAGDWHLLRQVGLVGIDRQGHLARLVNAARNVRAARATLEALPEPEGLSRADQTKRSHALQLLENAAPESVRLEHEHRRWAVHQTGAAKRLQSARNTLEQFEHLVDEENTFSVLHRLEEAYKSGQLKTYFQRYGDGRAISSGVFGGDSFDAARYETHLRRVAAEKIADARAEVAALEPEVDKLLEFADAPLRDWVEKGVTPGN